MAPGRVRRDVAPWDRRSLVNRRSPVPEGHAIHREARDQAPMLRGQVLAVSSPQGRFLEGAALIDGRRCAAVEA